VGLEWDHEDPHFRAGQTPKLSLVGRLDGDFDGRPVTLLAEHRDLTLCVTKLSTLLSLRQTWKANLGPLRRLLEQADVRVRVRLGRLGTTEVFPKPNYLIGFFMPRG
jgi:hypothetical protein